MTYQVLVADALEREGESGVQRPRPRVISGTKGGCLKVGNCRVVVVKSAKEIFPLSMSLLQRLGRKSNTYQ